MAKVPGNLQTALLTTLQVAGILTLAVIAPNAVQLLEHFGLSDARKQRLRYEVPRTLKRLEKKKMVVKTSKGYKLTNRGLHALNLTLLSPPKPPKRWDKKWRLIIFDIPERKKSARDRLRRLISRYGLFELQRSVWVYPYPCQNLIEILKVELSLGDELHYLVAQSFEGDSYLRDRYSL